MHGHMSSSGQLLDRRSMAPGTSSMLRARRRDVNVKPNRVLDRNSSRGMIYENEELRLRTININAEVEKGINDIKKLRRENDQLRREIWNLRDEYDRLEALYKAKHASTDEEAEEDEDEEDEDEEDDEEGEDNSEETSLQNTDGDEGGKDNAGAEQEGDVLSVVEEEPEDISDNGDDRPKTVSFREETLHVPGRPQTVEPIPSINWPDSSFIPGPQLPVPQAFPSSLHSFFNNVSGDPRDQVLTPGGSEVVTTAILQRRQSYTHTGDQTKDTITCATSQHTTNSSGGYSYKSFPATDPPDLYPPSTECEAYSGPAPCFLRLNSVQPFTLVFPVSDQKLGNLSVQEVIDQLSGQLSGQLIQSLRGVRLVGGSCYLSFSAQHDADEALATELTLRGIPLQLEDASVGSTILSLSGVPHDLPDDAVATVLSHFGSLVGPVERRLYKGVDTGERLVRLRARLTIPRWIWLDGCRVCLKVLRSEDIANQHMARRKSFRSHINVQLKPIIDGDDSPTPPLPNTSTSGYSSNSQHKSSLANTNPFICGSVPSIPVAPDTDGNHFSHLNNTSVSTPNIFQESPFLFPSPFLTADPPGLRRINSVMGTMTLGGAENYSPRSASSPPTAASLRNTHTEDRTDTVGQTSIPPSPNTPRKTPQRHKPTRKISKMSTDSRRTNGETSSSDQDSPNKPGRRRPSTVNFKQKPILNRNLSSEQDCTGYEATYSERERSNSDLSSRQSICKRKLSTTGRESGKVPWCGCWGNGCI